MMAEMYLEITKLFFIVGAFMALILGIMLWFLPDTVEKLSSSGNKWYSSRRHTKPLDVMRDTDGFYFKNHLILGLLMLLLSAVALYLVFVRMPTTEQVVSIMGESSDALGLGLVLESFRWILIVIMLLGLPVWALLAFAPEHLKIINSKLNRWVSTRMLMLPLEKMNTSFDGFVLRNHRVFAMIFTLGALFILYKFLT